MKQLALVSGADLFRCVFFNPRMNHVRGFSFSQQRLANGQAACEKAEAYAEHQCKINDYRLLTLNFDRRNK